MFPRAPLLKVSFLNRMRASFVAHKTVSAHGLACRTYWYHEKKASGVPHARRRKHV